MGQSTNPCTTNMFKALILAALCASASAFQAQAASKVAASKVQMNANVQKAAAGVAALGLFAGQAVAGDFDSGKQTFSANCAACHAGGQNSVIPHHTLEKGAIEKFLSGGFNEAAVVYQVTNGKGAMPAFGGRLEDDEIEDVATYVIT